MKKKRLWDNYRVITEVPKTERLKFVVAAGTRDGFRCIVIREFYYSRPTNEWKPGRDGIIVPILSPMRGYFDDDGKIITLPVFASLIQAITEAYEVASTMDLADPNNSIWLEV